MIINRIGAGYVGAVANGHNRPLDLSANCFDYLRILSAVIIALGHIQSHLEIQLPSIINWLAFSFWQGLPCMFAISGFLIAYSFDRSPNRMNYLRNRSLRLYPGLWIATAVSFLCVLVIGSGYAGQHYNMKDIILWLGSQMSFLQFFTPLSLEQYGVGNPNGALWTVSMEIQIYIMIMLIFPWLKRRSGKQLLGLTLLLVLGNILFPYTKNYLPLIIYKLINVTFLPYAYYFMIGITIYLKRDILLYFVNRGGVVETIGDIFCMGNY